MKIIKNKKGQSLFEVVVAVAISALIMISIVSLVNNSVQNSSFSRNKTIAGNYAQQATEWLRGERDRDINTFSTNVQTPTWCFKDLNWSSAQARKCDGETDQIGGTPFSREATFTLSTAQTSEGAIKDVVEVSVRVFWEDSGGVHEVNSVTNLSDWRQR